MRAFALLLMLAMTTAATPTRAQFAAKLAKIKPGMTDAEVKKLLGAPDDIKTEKDPGGITAARTVEIWRYGAKGHLAFATLGAVHLQKDHTVQYVFGAKGKPYAGKVQEAELRGLLEMINAVASYNATLDPLTLIKAVNALVPLGKDGALEVIDEYLRVSSWLDDAGREGVFLLNRVLFDVPAAGMPPMMVGGAPEPSDKQALPRFPIEIVDDVPVKLVNGYMLAGHAEPPEDDVAAFRKIGTIRAKPLAPSPAALDAIEKWLVGLKAFPVDDGLRVYVFDQALRLFGTVHRPADMTVDGWFPYGKAVADRMKKARANVAAVKPVWNVKTQQFEKPDGTTLPALPGGFQRVWWDVALAGASAARLTLERISNDLVQVELRLEVAKGKAVNADFVKFFDPATNNVIATLEIAKLSVGGSVSSSRISLPKGKSVRVELGSGARGPTLAP